MVSPEDYEPLDPQEAHGDTGRAADSLDPVENLVDNEPGEEMPTEYTPPDEKPRILHDRPTAAEEHDDESLEDRLTEEQPDR